MNFFIEARESALCVHVMPQDGNRRIVMDPIMCPFCGGDNLFQEDDYSLELDYELWTVHHWECLDCAQSFDKIEVLPASNSFETINNESTIH